MGAYLLSLCATNQAPILNFLMGARFWTPIAGLSYSMYLCQFIGGFLFYEPYLHAHGTSYGKSYHAATEAATIAFGWVSIILFILGAAIVGAVNYTLVERPGINLGKRVVAMVTRGLKPDVGSKNEDTVPKARDLEAATPARD